MYGFLPKPSNRYSHHLVDWARTQSTTTHRRRALNSRRARQKSGGRWAAGGPPPRARTSRPPHNTHQSQSKRRTHSVHEPQKEPLSFRKSSFSYVYLSAAAILCGNFSSLSSNFRGFAFLAGFALFPKSRKVTKIGHTVWPPPINRRKKRKDSAFHSGRFQVLLWCRLCQTATIIIWSLGKRRKRPKPKPTAAAATPNEPKGTKEARRSHSVRAN